MSPRHGCAQTAPRPIFRRGGPCARPLRLGWLLGLLCAIPVLIRAADEAAIVLPPWIIEETRPATAAVHGDYFASILGPVSAVTAGDWSGRSITTLAEALRRTPGVMLQESFGGFEPPRLSIRGSGLDSAPTSRGVALLLDGLPLARADGSFHSGLFDPLLFPRVEIYRGTLHMALTPAVLGGVLNAGSFDPAAPPAVTLGAQAGDFGAWRTQLSARTAGPLLGQAAAALQQSDGWREHSTQERAALQFALHRSVGDDARLDVSAYAARADYEVPGPLTLALAETAPRSVNAAVQRDRPRRDSSVVHFATQFKSRTAHGESAFGLAALGYQDEFFQLQPNGVTDLNAHAVSGHATFSRRVNLGGTSHQWLARLTGTTGRDTVDRYLNMNAQRGARFGSFHAHADTVALSVEDVVWLRPHFALGAGFTALQGRREVTGRAPSPGLRAKLDFDDFSPRGGVLWAPRESFTLHAAVSRSIEPPTFDDLVTVQGAHPNLALATRPLRPQSAVTFETGLRGRTGQIDWSITAYRAAWRREILRLADANGLPRGAVNAARSRHEGLESSLRWHLRDDAHKLTLTLTSTLGHFRFDDDPVHGGNRLAGAPPHTGSADLSYESPRGFFAGIETNWVAGRIPVDHANRMFYDGHTLTQLRAGWRPSPRWLIHLTVRNLFDRDHLASTAGVLDVARNPAATAIFLPGPGRGFTLGAELKL